MADSGTNPVRPNTFELEADVNVEFNEATSRQQINSGESVKTLFGKLRKFLTDLKAVAFSGAYSDLSGAPDLTKYALKSKYGDTTINVGRKAGTTVGEYSTAEGSGTTASGNGSHSEGGNSIASGSFSHAEGADTTASNYSSHAGGSVSEASGRYSFSHGNRTQALHESEVAFGQNNISNDDTLFSIGDGAYNARHNAFEITKTGGKLHDKDIATLDDIPDSLKPSDIKRLSYTITFNEITWSTSGYGKYYYDIALPENINVISVYGGAFEAFYPDEVVQVHLSSNKIIELISNVDKRTGRFTVHISYF